MMLISSQNPTEKDSHYRARRPAGKTTRMHTMNVQAQEMAQVPTLRLQGNQHTTATPNYSNAPRPGRQTLEKVWRK